MTRAIISSEEWHPVLELVLRESLEKEEDLRWFDYESIEVPQGLVDRYTACMREFESIQKEIMALRAWK